MDGAAFTRLIAAAPHPTPGDATLAADEAAIAASARYLASPAALDSLAADPYWPKWHSPWWHILLLHELGAGHRIPDAAIAAMIDALARLPVHIFPIHPGELPAGLDPHRHVMCHCGLGSIHQVLTTRGVDVEAALPWVRSWFARYQLADGGLSCDAAAYLAPGPPPSSMVGTIAAFEALLAVDSEPDVVDRAAAFVLGRRLVLGSPTDFNADERRAAAHWPQLTFPRFYFYDVLRGLSVLTRWAERRARPLPLDVVAPVVEALATRFADGVVRVERHGFAGWGSFVRGDDGTWRRSPTAERFPAMAAISAIGAPSTALTRQWSDTLGRLQRLTWT